jgi:hypothetical protein
MLFGWQGKEINLVCLAKNDMRHAVSENIEKKCPPSLETPGWREALVLGQHPVGCHGGLGFPNRLLGPIWGTVFGGFSRVSKFSWTAVIIIGIIIVRIAVFSNIGRCSRGQSRMAS